MKTAKVLVRWEHGLHLRPAARLVRLAQGFRSTVVLRFGGRMADLRSILSIVSLCAAMGTALDVEVNGDDEDRAVQAIEQAFTLDDSGRDPRG